jgi:hypothetical protein
MQQGSLIQTDKNILKVHMAKNVGLDRVDNSSKCSLLKVSFLSTLAYPSRQKTNVAHLTLVIVSYVIFILPASSQPVFLTMPTSLSTMFGCTQHE